MKSIFRRYSIILIVGSFLGIIIHIGIIGLDVLLAEKPIVIDLEDKFLQSAFSFPFLPSLIFEILFSIFIIFLWNSMQTAIKKAHEQDIKKEKYKTTVATMQKLMALMADYIAVNNNEILSKIEFRRKKGQNTSHTIEVASKNISKILGILSEISYYQPYLKSTDPTTVDLLTQLEVRIKQLEEKEISDF